MVNFFTWVILFIMGWILICACHLIYVFVRFLFRRLLGLIRRFQPAAAVMPSDVPRKPNSGDQKA